MRIFSLQGWTTFLMIIAVLTDLAVSVSPAEGDSSVLSLFNLRDENRLWEEDLLVKTFDDLEKPTKVYSGHTEIDYYMHQGNLAAYMGLEHVEAIYLPIPINFLFVGFSGTGNHGLRLGKEELTRWFEHIDHLQQHTRVPQDVDTWHLAHHLPRVSYTHYNFTIRAMEMGQSVGKVFDDAIRILARKLDPHDHRSDEEVWWQVDMEQMGQLAGDLLHHLELDNAYNIFIMNPNRNTTRKHYGYRFGISEAEMELIFKYPARKDALLGPRLEKLPEYFVVEAMKMPLFTSRPAKKLTFKSIQHHETAHWTARFSRLLDAQKQDLAGLTDPAESVLHKAQQIITSRAAHRSRALKKAIKEGGALGGWQPECLVDAFTSSQRWAMIDLTAGPFTWGPQVGGEGVRTEASLPSVEEVFRQISIVPNAKTDKELEEELHSLASERFQTVEDDAGHEVDMLLAEMDVYEHFMNEHCANRGHAIPVCTELQTRLDKMKNEFAHHLEHSNDPLKTLHARTALQKLHSWNLQERGALEIHGDIGGEEAPHHNISRAWDVFLSDVGAMLTGAMRHFVTPSTADGAFHYYDKMSFHIYLVTQQTYYNRQRTPLDVESLKAELALLRLPTQKFQFSVHKLSIADDPALALAYTGAIRSATVHHLLPNGSTEAKQHMYLDSGHLQHQLRLLSDNQLHRQRKSKEQRSFKEVPIFVFAVSGSTVLIDRSEVAKALPDMVLAVQLEDPHWPTELQCNGNPVHWDLRNPIKAIVAATLHHVAGLLPSHVAYSSAHEAVNHDWRWSVGGHPLAATCREHVLSELQRDAAARSFIVTALDESIEEVNAGIALLARETTHEETYHIFKREKERHLLADYNHVVELWKQIAQLVERLDLGSAAQLLAMLEQKSKSFHGYAKGVVSALHPVRCTRHRRLQLANVHKASILGCIILCCLFAIYRPRRLKPKVN